MYIIITSDVIEFVVIYIVQLSHYSGNLNTLGTKIFVLISEVSLFQGEDLYKVMTQSGALINQVSLFQGCPISGFHCTVQVPLVV